MIRLTTRHYLDHAATAPVREAALSAWVEASRALQAAPGNPSALHAGGRTARSLLEDARERVAVALGAERAEVVFTSGATEADALAVAGGARSVRASDPVRTRIWSSLVEHDAVSAQREVLAREGFSWESMGLGADGVTILDERITAPDVALVSLALVSSEVGTVQPVGGVVETLTRARREDAPLVHTDAAQALNSLDVDFHALGVDLMSIGGHKIGAPVGTGALLVRRGLTLVTDRPGGGQERHIRSGTPDIAGAVALAAALELTVAERDHARAHVASLRERLVRQLPQGAAPTLPPGTPAVPSIVHLSIDTAHPEAVLMAMDAAGVLVSAGSACRAGVTRPSEVVMAMGRSETQALGVLRVSLGSTNTTEDIDALLAALPGAIRAGQALDGRARPALVNEKDTHT